MPIMRTKIVKCKICFYNVAGLLGAIKRVSHIIFLYPTGSSILLTSCQWWIIYTVKLSEWVMAGVGGVNYFI